MPCLFRLPVLVLAAALIPLAPVQAQDLPTDQLNNHADVVRQNILRDKTVFRNRPNIGRGRSYNQNKGRVAGPRAAQASRAGTSASRARATCANKGRAAALHGHGDPRVRQLYALCAQAGY